MSFGAEAGRMVQRSHWRWWLLLAVLAGAAAVVWRMAVNTERAPRFERPIVRGAVLRPELEELPVLREVPGKVVSIFEATLASKVSGLVEELRVKEGDRVKGGDTLIVLDSRDLNAQLQQAQAELDNAEDHYRRTQQLFAEQLASRQDLENAERTFKVAQSAKHAIDANLTYTVIKAPFDGAITEKIAEVGELATPGRPLLKMEDDRRLRLEVTVAAADLGALRVGQTVAIALDASGEDTLSGRVSEILPAADPSTHSVTVKADLSWRAGLKSGLFGRMRFPIGSKKILTVPLSAIEQQADLARLYAVNETGIIQARLVKLGTIRGQRVEVLSGLDPGERILARASDGLDGARLQTAPDVP
jgi:RND family efflux transporter MFP subunit